MTEAVTEDWLLNEQVRLFQPATGYRAGLDAVLLAASLSGDEKARALEIGCGAGGALLTAAWRLSNVDFTGIEREPRMAELARRGVAANGFTGRVNIVEGDITQRSAEWENRFDLVFSNPPYFEPGRIQAPHAEREHAYMADVALKDWLKHMLFVTRPKGRISLIHRAGEIGEILSYLISRTGQIEVIPVRSAPGEAAKRVIVTARKGLRRGEVVLHDGLTMYVRKGGRDYTERAEGILKGKALTL